MTYIHELENWPEFKWAVEKVTSLLAEVRHKQGLLLGRMSTLGFSLKNEASLEVLTSDVIKSSAIEGEYLDREQVRSSIARKLGVDIGSMAAVDRHVEGIVTMMLDATQHYDTPLTKDRLLGWHAALFPTGRSGMRAINVGQWRNSGDMQVVSGPIGKEKVHFQAPAARQLEKEMEAFLDCLQMSSLDNVLKAAIAHFWFVTIHPFDDGNGRIARAIADMSLARSDKSKQRFYSMSARIEHERKEYYSTLERCQKDNLDITPWLVWFLSCLERAVDSADSTISSVLRKAEIWKKANLHPVNPRQQRVINRLLDNFEGKLTTSKYAKLAKCSQDTALRDIRELMNWDVLIQNPEGGRSTNYRLGPVKK